MKVGMIGCGVISRQYLDSFEHLPDFAKAREVYAVDPDTLPNTYLKYYFYPQDEVP
jgi:maltose-6'-phosphate glucosidase